MLLPSSIYSTHLSGSPASDPSPSYRRHVRRNERPVPAGCLQSRFYSSQAPDPRASPFDAHNEVHSDPDDFSFSLDPSLLFSPHPKQLSNIFSSISTSIISNPIDGHLHPHPLPAENGDRLYAQTDDDHVCMHPAFQNSDEIYVLPKTIILVLVNMH
jgi:hypothetical protein